MMLALPMPALLAIAILGGYLIGSIPFGLILTKMAGLGDIRTIGSGNIGATNVLRTGKKWLAAGTLSLDVLKGAAAVLLAATFTPGLVSFAGLAAVIGHMFPVWLKFKGGKGVATALGVVTAAAWPVGLSCLGTWLVVAYMFRISSLAALAAIAMAPMYTLILYRNEYLIMVGLISFLVWLKHRDNIKRLYAGNEPKISFSRNLPTKQ